MVEESGIFEAGIPDFSQALAGREAKPLLKTRPMQRGKNLGVPAMKKPIFQFAWVYSVLKDYKLLLRNFRSMCPRFSSGLPTRKAKPCVTHGRCKRMKNLRMQAKKKSILKHERYNGGDKGFSSSSI